jgi:hypothetical protein
MDSHLVLAVELYDENDASLFVFTADAISITEKGMVASFPTVEIRDAFVRDTNKVPFVCCAAIEADEGDERFAVMLQGFRVVNVHPLTTGEMESWVKNFE